MVLIGLAICRDSCIIFGISNLKRCTTREVCVRVGHNLPSTFSLAPIPVAKMHQSGVTAQLSKEVVKAEGQLKTVLKGQQSDTGQWEGWLTLK